jgi:hypothetical protein
MVDNRFRFEGLIKALCALASERGNLNDRVDAAISRLPITPPTQMRNATMAYPRCTSRSLHWLRPALGS